MTNVKIFFFTSITCRVIFLILHNTEKTAPIKSAGNFEVHSKHGRLSGPESLFMKFLLISPLTVFLFYFNLHCIYIVPTANVEDTFYVLYERLQNLNLFPRNRTQFIAKERPWIREESKALSRKSRKVFVLKMSCCREECRSCIRFNTNKMLLREHCRQPERWLEFKKRYGLQELPSIFLTWSVTMLLQMLK